MSPSQKTWKTISDQRRKENFVGRAEQIKVFLDNYNKGEPTWMVLSVTGQGGVGKSTLLKRYIQLADSSEIKANIVLCDDRHYSPVDVMGYIAEQLKKFEIESGPFNERYKKYRETLQQIESDPKAPRTMVDVVTRGLTDFAVKSMRRAPGVGVAMEYVDEKAAGDAIVELTHYAITRWGNKDEVELVREPEKILTPLFIELLNLATEKKRLIIMFDVFERTAATLSSWLIALFASQYGDISASVSFILSGRDPLEQLWTELAGLITHVQLEPFLLDETAVYLSNQGITDSALIKQIHDDTGGLPVLVELLAATNPQPNLPLPDITKDAVERFLQWTPDEDKRRAALLAAIPRQFNREILVALLPDNGSRLFDWLSDQSYSRVNTERGWFYHEKVRMLMLRYQKNTTPKELAKNHGLMENYYTTLQSDLALEGEECYRNEEWRRLELERTYHLFCAAPKRNLASLMDAFMAAILHYWQFAGDIARIAKQAVHDSLASAVQGDIECISELAIAYEKDDFIRSIQLLDKFQSFRYLNKKSIIVSSYCCGYCNLQLNKYEVALQDYTRAIDLDERFTKAIANRGVTYRLMGKYEEALQDLNRAIELDEKFTWAIASRGETYLQMGKYEEALQDFNRAIELDEKESWVIANRGETYRLMGKYEEALQDFTLVIELDVKDTWAIASRGQTYRAMGKYEEALQDFTRAIELDEKESWVIGERGATYRQMGKYEEALQDFTRATELDEKYTWAIARRGETYLQMGKYEEAFQDFTLVIELDVKDTWAIARRGETYRQMDKYEEALQDLNRAVELDEKYTWAIAKRGETYRQMGKYEEALQDFTCATELDEKYTWAIASRGRTYRAMGKYAEALVDFNRAIELDEKNIWAIARRGETYLQMDKYEEALQDLNRAVELDEKYTWAIARRGETYLQMGKYEEALQDLNRAVELDEKTTWAIASRGRTYRAMGKYAEALVDFNRAIELDEKNIWAIASRGQTYRLMGKYEEALNDFNRVIEKDEKNFWAYYQRGDTYRRMKKYDKALSDLSVVISDGDPDTGDYACRAAIYLSLNQNESAKQDLEKGLSLECQKQEEHYGRAIALILGDHIADALADLEIAFNDLFYRTFSLSDDLLDSIRELPGYKALLAKYE